MKSSKLKHVWMPLNLRSLNVVSHRGNHMDEKNQNQESDPNQLSLPLDNLETQDEPQQLEMFV